MWTETRFCMYGGKCAVIMQEILGAIVQSLVATATSCPEFALASRTPYHLALIFHWAELTADVVSNEPQKKYNYEHALLRQEVLPQWFRRNAANTKSWSIVVATGCNPSCALPTPEHLHDSPQSAVGWRGHHHCAGASTTTTTTTTTTSARCVSAANTISMETGIFNRKPVLTNASLINYTNYR